MKKEEFLSGLRAALALEIPDSEIESNLRFYEDYINGKIKEKEEEIVIDELGDPRLIAKTIIETYQIAHGPMYQNNKNDKSYNKSYEYEDYNDNEGDDYQRKDNRGIKFQLQSPLKWYHKLLIFLILMFALFIVIVVGGVIIRLLFSIGVPLLILYFGYTIIKNSMRK